MFLRELRNPISELHGAGTVIARRLSSLGIINIAGLLSYYPRDWEDRSRERPLASSRADGQVCAKVRVLAHDWFGYGRMKTLKVHIEDDSARAVLLCFNRPFLEKQLPIGADFWVWGRFYYKYGELQSSAFEFEKADEGHGSFGRILPVYPLSADLNQGVLRRLVDQALKLYVPRLEDELPASLRERYALPPKTRSLNDIHFPSTMAALAEAKKALVYEELFYLEVTVGKRALERKRQSRRGGSSVSDPSLSPLQKRLMDRLPFALTEGQLSALSELNADLCGPFPMARLLQGDVGSGKTLVAFMACLRVIEKGRQAAVMAPTELLARQHAENAARLLEPLGIRPAFLTGNIKAAGRRELLNALHAGDIDLVVGTHALFSRDVVYHDLGLVVIDEQHRFGVVQRSAIQTKGEASDLLMMSATPIPRTLAHTVFGDLDVSYIRDMPSGRKPPITHLAARRNEKKVYDFVRRELKEGRQAYFVYPLIDADEAKRLKDAETMVKLLARDIFPEFPTALIHSKLTEENKRETMEAFRAGSVRVLVATSVVEVGVDVPNASCMVVEHAERFGLSALHQMRGRVGRGGGQAYCFLVYSDELTEDGKARLRIMLENTDGFVIAEEDLKLRGPGQLVGLEQSGYLSLGIADPVRDAEVLAKAREDAFSILKEDGADRRLIEAVLERAAPYTEAAR